MLGIVGTREDNRGRSRRWRDKTRLHRLPWKLSFIPHSESVELRGDIYGNAYTCSHMRFSVLCLAARLTLNFVAPFLWRTHLRAVRYASLYRLLLRTSGLGCVPIIPDTWISLISAAEYFKIPRDTGRQDLRSTNTTFR